MGFIIVNYPTKQKIDNMTKRNTLTDGAAGNSKPEGLCNCGPETHLHGKTGTAECQEPAPAAKGTMLLQTVKAAQDEAGHWYVIPNNLYDRFRELHNTAIDYNSPYQEQAQTEFIDEFHKYRTGGDLNNVQLYAEKK
jgi:hypothetical protein